MIDTMVGVWLSSNARGRTARAQHDPTRTTGCSLASRRWITLFWSTYYNQDKPRYLHYNEGTYTKKRIFVL